MNCWTWSKRSANSPQGPRGYEDIGYELAALSPVQLEQQQHETEDKNLLSEVKDTVEEVIT
jgi:hypothetical protein